MVPRIAGRLNQFVNYPFRRGDIGIAHAKIYDVLTGSAGSSLQLVHDRKNVRRKSLYASELH